MRNINNLKNTYSSVIIFGGAAESARNVSEHIDSTVNGRAVAAHDFVFLSQDAPVRTSAGTLDVLRSELKESDSKITSNKESDERFFVNIQLQDDCNLVYGNKRIL